MVVEMLEAVSEMMSLKNDDDAVKAMERVRCAKMMLDKIIAGMKKETLLSEKPQIHTLNVEEHQGTLRKAEVPLNAKPAKSLESNVKIVVDKGKITSVLNATDDTKLELDGKVYPWTECIGKAFQTGRVL